MQHCPSHISRGRPPPPAREPGLTRTGGLPPAPQPRPQDKTVHVDPAQKNRRPCFWAVGFRAPPPATSDPRKWTLLVLAGKTPCLVLVTTSQKAGSCHTQAHAHTHIPASSHKRSDTPESLAPVDRSLCPPPPGIWLPPPLAGPSCKRPSRVELP